jgi:hypothetical protein
MRKDAEESKYGKLRYLGRIIGFVVVSAFISLDFWRWAWDVITWGLNHDWRDKVRNIECDLSVVARLCCCLAHVDE